MTGHPLSYRTFEPDDLSLDLLAALGILTPAQREAWIDRYVRGVQISGSQRSYVHAAKKRLRAAFAEAG